MATRRDSRPPGFRDLATALAGVAAVSGCAGPWQRQPAEGFRAELEGSVRYGPVSGYLQTPSGGAPGTTSGRRPTLRELDLDDALSPEASVGLHWREHGLQAGASLVRLAGDSTLDTPLVSHGTTFPAGTSVHSDVRLDWYRLGYQYRLTWVDEAGTSLSLSPAVGAALLDFDYSLKADGGLATHRGYVVGTPQLGLGAEWAPPSRFSVAGGVLSSVPGVADLFILSAQLSGSYQLWGRGERGGRALVGVGYEWLEYEDHQQVPNHIQVELGPMIRFGITARL